MGAVGPKPDWLRADTHPEYVRFDFECHAGAAGYRLPYPLERPQAMVYPTEAFAALSGDPTGFSRQLEALTGLLRDRPDLMPLLAAAMARGLQESPYLPFLPGLNSTQAFCAQPRCVEFKGGRGVRYLTVFLREAAISDSQRFYAFQGVSYGGMSSVVAILPLTTTAFSEQGAAETGAFGPDAWRAFSLAELAG